MTTPIQNQSDENLARWTKASLNGFFENTVNAGISPVPPFSVTGYNLNSDENQDHIEMRLMGPHEKDNSGFLVLEIQISFLMTFRQDNVKDMFTLDRWAGVYKDVLRKPIEFFRKGNDPGDDDSLIGCYTLKQSKRELIRDDRYGFLDGNTPIQQATVVATLDTWLPWS
jgi:hypothetical protein